MTAIRALSATILTLLAACGSQPAKRPEAEARPAGTIAFTRFLDVAQKASAIFTIHTDGTNAKQLTHPPAGASDDHAAWSPDASTIAFDRCDDSGCRLWTTSASGGAENALAATCVAGVTKCESSQASFSPDGRSLAFGAAWGAVDEKLDQIEHAEIAVVSVRGGVAKAITHSAPYASDVGSPQWSADGKKIAFARVNSAKGRPSKGRAVFVADANGAHLAQVTQWPVGASVVADWSRATDSLLIRVVADEEAGHGNFYTVSPDGSTLTQATHFTDQLISHEAAFSPDGKWLVFATTDRDRTNSLFLVKVGETQIQQVTLSPFWDTTPAWKPM